MGILTVKTRKVPIKATNGYMVLWVGRKHRLASGNGYAYVHRLVAEQKLGRRLRPGEVVHHVNGDNSPDNLEVVADAAAHTRAHYPTDGRLRQAGEPNPQVRCKCGCGEAFRKYDAIGRPRMYVNGHNGSKADNVRNRLLKAIGVQAEHISVLADRSGLAVPTVQSTLCVLKRLGMVVRESKGHWRKHG